MSTKRPINVKEKSRLKLLIENAPRFIFLTKNYKIDIRRLNSLQTMAVATPTFNDSVVIRPAG